MALPLFWLALVSQLIIVVGYFWFYRKEQLCEQCIESRSLLDAEMPLP
jgi:alpha-1,3-glucan synthase